MFPTDKSQVAYPEDVWLCGEGREGGTTCVVTLSKAEEGGLGWRKTLIMSAVDLAWRDGHSAVSRDLGQYSAD